MADPVSLGTSRHKLYQIFIKSLSNIYQIFIKSLSSFQFGHWRPESFLQVLVMLLCMPVATFLAKTWDDAADILHCLPVPFRCSRGICCQQLSPRYEWPSDALSGWWCFWQNLSKSLTSHLPLLRTSASYGANTVFEKFVPKAWTLSCATHCHHCPVEHCGCNATCNKNNKRECAPAPARTYTHTQKKKKLNGWCRLRSDPSRTWIRDHSCGFWASCHVDNT